MSKQKKKATPNTSNTTTAHTSDASARDTMQNDKANTNGMTASNANASKVVQSNRKNASDTVQDSTTDIERIPLERSTGETGSSHITPPTPRDPYLRPATEDDDGYDPYSDRREESPLFEPDPWS